LRAALPEKLRPLFETMLTELESRGMLIEGLGAATVRGHPYESTLLFLQEHSTRWQDAFANWSRLPLTIGGAPALVPLLVRALIASGASNLRIVAGSLDPEDQAEIDALAAEHAGHHESFRCNGADPSAVVDGDRDAGALLVWLTQAIPTPEEAALLTRLAACHGTCLFGGVHGGIAVLGPETADGPSAWMDILARAEPGDVPFTAAAGAVLSSLTAFEVLHARLAPWSDQPDEEDWRQGHVRVVRADGSVSTHDSRAALSGARAITATSTAETLLPAPRDAEFAPWFDPVVGPFGWAEVDGPEYPLPHRAIALQPTVAGGGTAIVSDWGHDPDAAEERALMLAIAASESARVGHAAAAGISPLFAARSEEELLGTSGAVARATMPSFTARFGVRPVDAQLLDDPEARMLAQLARLYTGSYPALRIAGKEGTDTFLAEATVGAWTAAAASHSAARALIEALGDALSAFQRGAAAYRQLAAPLPSLSAAAASAFPDPPELDPWPPRTELHRIDTPHLPSGIYVGYAAIPG
jgi:hypothetical protein